MNTESRDRSIDEAARWYARLRSPSCTALDRAEFEAWHQRQPGNARAFAAAQRLAEDLFETISADDRLQAMAEEAFAMGSAQTLPRQSAAAIEARTPTAPGRLREWWMPAAIAATLLVVAGVVSELQHRGAAPPEAVHYASAGEMRRIHLDDGSRVFLDVHTELDVRYTPLRRELVLSAGRAIFDVARDVDRPFTVTTRMGVVTAVGTRFEVRQDDDFVVTLASGVVTVAAAATLQSERLAPGEQLSIARGEPAWVRRQVDVEAATGWIRGRLTFRDTQLSDALDEVNRYAVTKLRIADPSLAQMTVSGSFVSDDSASVAAAIAAVLPIRVVDGGDELLLFRRWERAIAPQE